MANIVYAQWQQTSFDSTSINCIAVVYGTDIVAGPYDYGVYRSTDNGLNWTADNAGLTNHFVNAFAVSLSNIYAGTNGGGVFLYNSTDSAGSWSEVNAGLTALTIFSLVSDGTNIFAGTFQGGVFFSANDGTNWTGVNTGLPNNTSVYSIAINGTDIFVGTELYGVYYSSNNGANWTAVNNGIPANSTIYSLSISGTNIYAGVNSSGVCGVFLSTDNGTSWSAVNNGLPNSNINELVASGTNIFAGTQGNGVYFSTDNGANWIEVNTGLTDLTIFSLAISGTDIYAGTDNEGIWKRPLSDFTGINEIKENSNIVIYPNPVTTTITIEASPKPEIDFLNIEGQTIKTIRNVDKKTTVDLSNFASGIYTLRIKTDRGVVVRKLIKQ